MGRTESQFSTVELAEFQFLTFGCRDPPFGQVGVDLVGERGMQGFTQITEGLGEISFRVSDLVKLFPPKVGGVKLIIFVHFKEILGEV